MSTKDNDMRTLVDLLKRVALDEPSLHALSRELQRRGYGQNHTLTLRGLPPGCEVTICPSNETDPLHTVRGTDGDVRWEYDPSLSGEEVSVYILHMNYQWTAIQVVLNPGQVIPVVLKRDLYDPLLT